MSLAIKYESVEDAQMRLRNTVVLYKGKPVVVTSVQHGRGEDEGPMRVLIQDLPINLAKAEPFDRGLRLEDEKAERKYISSKYFDIAPFPLGYVNSPDGAFYCARLPNRVQKQGLCAENFSGKLNNGMSVNWQTFLKCKETPAMIANNYPSFDKAMAALERCPSVAFSREFCLVKDEVLPDLIFLYHKGVKVGWYNKEGISLGQKFRCLKECLKEMPLRVGVN